MPKLDDGQDDKYAMGRKPEYFYVSTRFPYAGDEGEAEPRTSRFAYQVFDSSEDLLFESENGWETVLRQTPTRQQLKALFFEDSRRILQLGFERFAPSGKKMNSDYFVLHGDEILDLAAFLGLVMAPSVELVEGDKGTRLTRSLVAKLLSDHATQRDLYEQNREELVEFLRSDVSAPEVIAVARRRGQLDIFESLLRDPVTLEERVTSSSGPGAERAWQDFFEQNRWIFGAGLTTQFLHSWSPEALQQTVVGASIKRAGKRPDGLMRTAGVISSMVFVEIKTHTTPLLAPGEYRGEAFAPSRELVGAVAQCQSTVDAAVEELGPRFRGRDPGGFETGEVVELCRPRSLLVVGSLDEFMRDGKVHEARFRSFERYRRSISDPEIVTFDELLERVRLVLSIDEAELNRNA